MADASDIELLRNYTRQGADDAFAELVRRHIHLVYSAALRHAGIAAHAEEITQAVFVILAQKAGRLREGIILEAWLYQTTRFTALSFLRGERRRQLREQEAYMQSRLQQTGNFPVWNELAPLLDEAMSRLVEKDREVILLRFFKEKKLDEVAAAMNITSAAAQSRVHRALEKLRIYFSKRGVNSTAETIAGTISANSVQVAPVTLAKTVTAVALAKGATASISTPTLIKGALKIMAWTKAKTAVVAGLAIILAAGTATTMVERQKHQNKAPVFVSRSAWAFAGYASPEATMQSLLWALNKHDDKAFQMYLNGFTPELRDNLENEAQKRGPNAFTELSAHEIGGMTAFCILKKVMLSNDTAQLTMQSSGPKGPINSLLMKNIGGEWKVAGEVARTSVKERTYRIAEMDMMRGSVFPAVMQFAREHQDEIPTSMADLKPYLPADASGVDDDHWQISATGKLTPLLRRGDVILFQQKNVPPDQKQKITVYADGHIAWN